VAVSGLKRAPAVDTVHGALRGRRVPSGLVFKGIRYAQAPHGVRRYLPPQPPRPWGGIRDATSFGHDCPQLRSRFGALGAFTSRETCGDDMLCLNIWTPAADDAKRPVMVWIHGGAFITGSGAAPMYDGAAFARDDVVLVTINYRLHALGFLHLDQVFADGSANLAVLDQVAALRWVRDNIAAFGGDPENVTIFGQSAGAGCVGALLGTPAADGLYRRAILQSGAASHALPAPVATRIAERVLDMLRVRSWAGLWHVNPRRVVHAAARVFWFEAMRLLGEHRELTLPFLPAGPPPIERVRAGERAGVDVLVGTCADEYRAFVWGLPPVLRGLLPYVDVGPARVREAYAERMADAGTPSLKAAIAGDHMFVVPALRLAEAQVRAGGRAHMYRFTWASPVRGGELGACHGLDLPFAFDTLRHVGSIWGRNPPQDLADEMHAAFVRFATDGDPGWRPYDLDDRPTMEFGVRRRVVNDPRRAERRLWEGTW